MAISVQAGGPRSVELVAADTWYELTFSSSIRSINVRSATAEVRVSASKTDGDAFVSTDDHWALSAGEGPAIDVSGWGKILVCASAAGYIRVASV